MGRIFDLFVNKYNYTDFHELNLDWIISDIRTLAEIVENFVSLNTIKYANPIQWNISRQYGVNTVVVDPQTGTAYISVAPVPSGVALTNPDYWTVIFDLDIAQANNNITLRDDGNNVLSTFTSVVGDWLLWNGTLYIVTQDIALSQAYVPGYNIDRYTVELFIHDLKTELANEITNLETELMNEITDKYNAVISKVGDLDDLDTQTKTNLVAAINEIYSKVISVQENINVYNVKNYGVVGDGVTDDTDAINDLIDNLPDGSSLYFPAGTYLIREVSAVTPTGNMSQLYAANLGIKIFDKTGFELYGDGNATIFKGIDPAGSCTGNIINCKNVDTLNIHDIRIEGNLGTHVNVTTTGNMKDEWLYGIHIWGNSNNCIIHNVRFNNCHGDGLNLHDVGSFRTNIHVNDCTFTYCGRNGVQVVLVKNFFSNNCNFDHMTGAQTTGCAYDIESELGNITDGVYITNCKWSNTVQGCAVNTSRNILVTGCHGDSAYMQIPLSYQDVVFDYGVGACMNDCEITNGYMTNGVFINGCKINRLTLLTAAGTGTAKAALKNSNVDTFVFYGSFDGLFDIISNNMRIFQIEPNYTVKGLSVIGNTVTGRSFLRAANCTIKNNIFGGDDADGEWVLRIYNTDGKDIIEGNTFICNSTTRSTQRINISDSECDFINNYIDDTYGSGISCVITAPTKLIANSNNVNASGSAYALQLVATTLLLADNNITISAGGITISSGTNQTGAINRNYNI